MTVQAFTMRAQGQGFEPRSVGPKPTVLPLNDPRRLYWFNDRRILEC